MTPGGPQPQDAISSDPQPASAPAPDPEGTNLPHSGPHQLAGADGTRREADDPSAGAFTSGADEPNAAEGDRQDPDLPRVDRALAGDAAAFEELVGRHQDRVYTQVYFMTQDRHLAEDLAQETFLRVHLGLAGFRREALFSTWVSRIATNVTLHHFERQRTQKRKARVISIDQGRDDPDGGRALEIPDRSHLPDEFVVRNERQAAIIEAVAELPTDFRAALALRELNGYSYQEIADSLDIPVGTVKSKIFRARQILQDRLKGVL